MAFQAIANHVIIFSAQTVQRYFLHLEHLTSNQFKQWLDNCLEGYANPPTHLAFPNNVQSRHWDLYVFDLAQGEVTLYCSKGWRIDAKKVVTFTKIIRMCYPQVDKDFEITERRGIGPRQRSDWECGYFVLCTIEKILRNQPLKISDYRMRTLVKMMRDELSLYGESLDRNTVQ